MKSFAVVGKISRKIHHDGSRYLIYLDGFVAEDKMFELKGKGLMVEVEEIRMHVKRK